MTERGTLEERIAPFANQLFEETKVRHNAELGCWPGTEYVALAIIAAVRSEVRAIAEELEKPSIDPLLLAAKIRREYGIEG